MTTVITDPTISDPLIAERKRRGIDGFDEVWDGVYMVATIADDEHQDIQGKLATILLSTLGWESVAKVRAGINVSDRAEAWTYNFRVPDVAVSLPGGRAVNCREFWFGGPELVIEIVSQYDQTREKLPFYEKVGVCEVLMIEREPWAVELHRLIAGQLELVSRIEPDSPETIVTETVPLSMRLISGRPRPQIEITQPGTSQQWLI